MRRFHRGQSGKGNSGSFARSRHDEAHGGLAQSAAPPMRDPSTMSVAELRHEAAQSLDDALYGIEANNNIERLRALDYHFPQGDFDDAVYSLQVLQAKLNKAPTPPPPDKRAKAIDTFKERLRISRDRRPAQSAMSVADLRDITQTRMSEASHLVAGNEYFAELAQIDPDFPHSEFNVAAHAVSTAQRRLSAAPPPPEISRKALSSWRSVQVANPAFASWQSYNPMAA